MIISLDEAREWLREDDSDNDPTITLLINSAEEYLIDATGRKFDSGNSRAKLFCLVLVTDWYENRELMGQKPSEKVRLTIQSILTQLQYGGEEVEF